jgi:predicted glycosyltransferase
MKIWFDLTNSPHINFFKELMTDLIDRGHNIIITCRPLANTVDLLELYKIPYQIVGKHYGKSLIKKILGFPIRIWQLYIYLHKKKIDVGISQSSFYSPLAGLLLGIPTIYTNDNEHAFGNKISFLFADKILIPEFIDTRKVVNFFVKQKKVTQYPGVKEGIYLWKKYKDFNREPVGQLKIYIRPEPRTAQYYNGREYFMDDIIKGLKDEFQISILPRDKEQSNHYLQEEFRGVVVCSKPLTLEKIAEDCSLFIGAGGTMTREIAIIGIPTISVYQDELLSVDKYLIKQGIMNYHPKLTIDKIRTIIKTSKRKSPEKALLLKGEEAYKLLFSEILKFNK